MSAKLQITLSCVSQELVSPSGQILGSFQSAVSFTCLLKVAKAPVGAEKLDLSWAQHDR